MLQLQQGGWRCNNCEIAETAENNCVCHSMLPVSSSRPPSRIVKNGIAYLAKYCRVPLLSTSIYFPFNDNYLLCLKEHGQHLAPQGSPYKKSAEPIWAMAIAPPRTQTGTLGHFISEKKCPKPSGQGLRPPPLRAMPLLAISMGLPFKC